MTFMTDAMYDLALRERRLPQGCIYARYIDGTRELCQYNILTDEYIVRHDWLEGGRVMTYTGKPIRAEEVGHIEDALRQRRREAIRSVNFYRAE